MFANLVDLNGIYLFVSLKMLFITLLFTIFALKIKHFTL